MRKKKMVSIKCFTDSPCPTRSIGRTSAPCPSLRAAATHHIANRQLHQLLDRTLQPWDEVVFTPCSLTPIAYVRSTFRSRRDHVEHVYTFWSKSDPEYAFVDAQSLPVEAPVQ